MAVVDIVVVVVVGFVVVVGSGSDNDRGDASPCPSNAGMRKMMNHLSTRKCACIHKLQAVPPPCAEFYAYALGEYRIYVPKAYIA